ncbi:MAG TPA: type II 3-dehydroquinate dehydratase [Crocinitomicaceae bacterium]|nr:type II 3-dehydroquinate dehydratase [Crocinitomicaceae bacterium]
MKLLIINGSNLNLLGKREPETYGNRSFEDYFQQLKAEFPTVELEYFQSNIEGELINKMQQTNADGIVLNAGGYTHTSVSIRDCIAAIATPVVEVHISNISAREEFRHTSLISPVAKGCIFGFGLKSYHLAITSFELIK